MNTPTKQQIEAALRHADELDDKQDRELLRLCADDLKLKGHIANAVAVILAAAYREQQREIEEIKQQRDTLAEALREIKNSEPANHNGELFYVRYTPDGDYAGEEQVNPLSLLAFIYPRVSEELAALKGEQP